MMTVADEHWKDLRRLALSEGVSREAVAKWRQRDVPPRWRLLLADRARREGLSQLASELLSTTSLSEAS
jgi:hypothetical protein